MRVRGEEAGDYFHFLCPRCNDSKRMRVSRQPHRETVGILVLYFRCEQCQFQGETKIDYRV